MSHNSVISRLSVSQRNRFYYYRWSNNPPIPSNEIITSIANVHIIPANSEIEKQVKSAKQGQIISLKGYLVHYKEGDSRNWWDWKSSMTRSDTGDGACEVFFVEKVRLHYINLICSQSRIKRDIAHTLLFSNHFYE